MAREIRRIILDESYRARVGHIGSALSIADVIATLYADVLTIPSPDDPDRDRFILSKGHAALALYGALFLKGWILESQLRSYCTDGSPLGVHPERDVRGIDFSTGSLGHGLRMGVGAALAARLQGSMRRVVVVLSDAECTEGSVWEAVMFAAHHRLANLMAVVDHNGQQALGYTKDVLDLSPLASRFAAFGWDAEEVDGHDIDGLTTVCRASGARKGQPRVVVAHTTFGKGVSFMQNQIKWHYWPMSEEEYRRARAEVDGTE